MKTVLDQCNDIFCIQTNLLTRLEDNMKDQNARLQHEYEMISKELEIERLKHAETRLQFQRERQETQEMEAELLVIRRQLGMEKHTFEKAFGLFHSKSIDNSVHSEQLIATITGLEALCQQREDELTRKDTELKRLHKKISTMKIAHKRELEELELSMKQQIYLASKGERMKKTFTKK